MMDNDSATETSSCYSERAPGTEYLYDLTLKHHALQHAPDGDHHVLLVPQPSLTDPNDPLRWPTWKKWMTLTNALTYSFFGGVTGPIMAAGLIELATRFDMPLQKLVYANGATLICQGVFTIFWMYAQPPPPLLASFFSSYTNT